MPVSCNSKECAFELLTAVSSFTGKELLHRLDQMNINSNTFEDEMLPAYKKISSHAEEVRKARESKATGFDDFDMEEIEGLSTQVVHAQGTRAVSNGSLTVLQGLITVLRFIFEPDQSNAKDYQLVFMKTMTRAAANSNNRRRRYQDPAKKSLWVHKIGFWCLNPAIIFSDMCKTTRSVILTSGTLSPVSYNRKRECVHMTDSSHLVYSLTHLHPSLVFHCK